MRILIAWLGRIVGCNPIRWWGNTKKMKSFVRRFAPPPPPVSDQCPVAVLVTPWMGSDVPWFSIAAGLFLAAEGKQVVFILDYSPFGLPKLGAPLVRRCITGVLKYLSTAYEIIDLQNFKENQRILGAEDRVFVEKLVDMNVTWALKGEFISEGREVYKSIVRKQLTAKVATIKNFLAEGRFTTFLIPGGVYGSSGLWVGLGKEAGIRVSTYDSAGPDGFMLSSDGVAAQCSDIPRAVTLGCARSSYVKELPYALAEGEEEMARRRGGTDKFLSQACAVTSMSRAVDHGILIALNSAWDSAALGLHAVFESSVQWVCETVRWILENTSVNAVVREHPSERLPIFRGTDNFREILHTQFGDNPRVVFISAEDPVNTYDLLGQVDLVVVYTSTIGVEAAALGKRVVTQSHSYYSGLGFVTKSTDRSGYFSSIAEALENPVLDQEAKISALYCFYMTQCCNWMFSPFCPEGFDTWVDMSPTVLAQDPMVRILVQSVMHGQPPALLNHLRKFNQNNLRLEEMV